MDFEHKGFLFSSRVFVKRQNRKMVISVKLLDNQLTFLLGGGTLIWKIKMDFSYFLFKQDRNFEIQKWEIKLESSDQIAMIEQEAF